MLLRVFQFLVIDRAARDVEALHAAVHRLHLRQIDRLSRLRRRRRLRALVLPAPCDWYSGTPCLPVGARLIGGRPARMMGFEFGVLCDCGALLLEVVERSTASLNSFTCLEETVPGIRGSRVCGLDRIGRAGDAHVMLPFRACFGNCCVSRPSCIGVRSPGERM